MVSVSRSGSTINFLLISVNFNDDVFGIHLHGSRAACFRFIAYRKFKEIESTHQTILVPFSPTWAKWD